MKISHRIARVGALAALGYASWIVPGTARASECATNWLVAPQDGARNVPVDTLLWSLGFIDATPRIRLLGPAGEVPLVQRWLSVGSVNGQDGTRSVLVPRSVLSPNTRYRVERRYEGISPSDDVTEYTWFETGAGPAGGTPPLPELGSIEPRGALGFGAVQRWVDLDVVHEGILIGDADAELGNVTSIDDLLVDEREDALPGGGAASSPLVRWVTSGSGLAMGIGDCLVWPEDRADHHDVRLGAFDLAGNFSGWVAADVTIPTAAEARALEDARQAEADAEHALLVQQATADSGDSNWFEEAGCELRPPRSNSHAGYLGLLLGAGLAGVFRQRHARRRV